MSENDTLFVRKERAGSTATRVWSHDGAVLELPVVEAMELLAIPDGGFTSVNAPAEQITPHPTVTTDPGTPSPDPTTGQPDGPGDGQGHEGKGGDAPPPATSAAPGASTEGDPDGPDGKPAARRGTSTSRK